MKKFLTCALCFIPTLACAVTLWYDTTGECDGWWLSTVPTGCPVADQKVTKFHPTISDNKVFAGIEIDGETLVNPDGTLTNPTSLTQEVKSKLATLAARGTKLTDTEYKKEYNRDETVTVKFNTGGGIISGGATKNMLPTENLPTLSTRPIDGATFTGWRDENNNVVTRVPDAVGATKTLTATWECDEDNWMNNNGLCIPNGVDTIYRADGETVPAGSAKAGDLAEDPNCSESETDATAACYNPHVIVHIHDKPAGSDVDVTNGNDGMTLECTRQWCWLRGNNNVTVGTDYNIIGKGVISSIKLPRATGYTFRGYYVVGSKNNEGIDRLVVYTNHTSANADVAAGPFFPRSSIENPGNWMTIHPAYNYIWYNPTTGTRYISGLPNAEGHSGPNGLHEVHVYGAWAKNCQPGDDNATCTLKIGGRNYTTGQPGMVYYDNKCPNGMHLTNANTNQPVCTADAGDFSINYTFKNQYSDTIQCGGATSETCTAGGNYNMFSQSDFENACSGVSGTLRYLKVNGTEWYSPNRSVGCNSNTLGTSGTTNVIGYICETCDSDEHGSCVDMTNDMYVLYNPTSGGSGHTGDCLFGGTCTNPTTHQSYTSNFTCKKLECESGYTAYRNDGKYSCMTQQEICQAEHPNDESACESYNFTCPNVTAPSGVNVGAGAPECAEGQDTSTCVCKYRVSCTDTYKTLLDGSGDAANGTWTCTGSACLNAQQALSQYSCFSCPNYNAAAAGISVATPVQNGNVCSYHVTGCKANEFLTYTEPTFSPNTYDGGNVTAGSNYDYTVICTGQHQCWDGFGPYSSLYYLTTVFGAFSCEDTAPEQPGGGGMSRKSHLLA